MVPSLILIAAAIYFGLLNLTKAVICVAAAIGNQGTEEQIKKTEADWKKIEDA